MQGLMVMVVTERERALERLTDDTLLAPGA